MQIIQSKGNIVEKILRDKEGKLIRANFFVYESEGRIKARLIDFTYIETIKGAVIAIASLIKQKITEVISYLENSFEVPELAFETIYTNGSKPRAPTL